MKNQFIIFLFLISLPIISFCQNEYHDLEKIDINKENRYIVTSNTLKVRIRKNDDYYKVKSSTPFYTLKKGDVVSIVSARKGLFGNVKSEWYEINYYDSNTGMVVYPPNRKPWYPRTVWGIVDGRYLKELKKTFFTVNKDYIPISMAGRRSMMLMKGDTIIAEDIPYKDDVSISLVKANSQIWFYGLRAGGGSRRGGYIDNSLLTKLQNQDSLKSENYKVTSYITEEENRAFLFNSVNKALFLFLIIGSIVFIFISWNRPKYKFEYNHFKINNKQFLIDIIKGKVIDLNRYQKTSYSTTPGRAYQSGNTVNFTAPKVNINTSNYSEIWIKENNGKEHLVTRNYDINSARVGSDITWLKLQNGFTLGLLYHNLGRYNYTKRANLKNVIDHAITRKFSFIKFGAILSIFAFGLYAMVNFIFKQHKLPNELFGYTDASINIASFSIKMYWLQFFCFTILLLIAYYIILSIKRSIALKRVSKKFEKDVLNLCEKLT